MKKKKSSFFGLFGSFRKEKPESPDKKKEVSQRNKTAVNEKSSPRKNDSQKEGGKRKSVLSLKRLSRMLSSSDKVTKDFIYLVLLSNYHLRKTKKKRSWKERIY